MPKFAANLTMMFNELDFMDRFKGAADAGFKGVEFLFPYAYPADALKDRLARHDLVQALFNMPPGDWEAGDRGIGALPGRESEFREGVEKAIEYARALDCPLLHAMAGLMPDGADGQKYRETYVENLRLAAEACAGNGIRLVIEAINTRDIPGYFLNRPAQAFAVIAEVASDNLFVLYDIYHAQITEGYLAETIRAHIDRIAHFQIAGVPGRHEPDVGEIHYPYLFEVVDSLPFTGWIGCEYRPKAGTTEGLGWARGYGIG